MSYRKKYEDSYLDDEDDEFDSDGKTDTERIVELIQKLSRTPKDDARIQKLTERLFMGAKLPGPPGMAAIHGIEQAIETYVIVGDTGTSVALYARLADVGVALGNKELYYQATDRMAELSSLEE